MHQADNVVIGVLRQNCWIINLRTVLKNVKSCCQRCILNTAAPKAPLMAPLPTFRTHPYNPPFLHTEVDYFGPLDVTVKRSTEKRWGAIFSCMPSQTLSGSILAARYPHLKGIKLSDYQKARPTVLIGLNHSHLLMPFGRKMGRPEEPLAIKTKLGWLIFGIDKICLSETNHLMIHKSEDLMTEMMRRYFSTEEFGVKPVKTVKSQALERAETIIEKTLKKTDGRYEVGLLWRDDDVILPNSYSNALRRLATQEKQLAKDPGLKNWLCKTFEEYQQKGYIRKLTKEEFKRQSQKIFYIYKIQ